MPAPHKVLAYKALQAIKKQIVTKPQPRPTVFSGKDSSLQLCDTLYHLGARRLCIVTDAPLRELGLLDPVLAKLAALGVDVCIYDGVQPDPSVKVVDDGLAVLRAHGSDSVLGFGGGSSIDSAKVIALAAANGFSAMQCVGISKGKVAALPLFAIPTTAGTGSEVTIAAVISDNTTHAKLIVGDRKIVPLAAALDPQLMLGLPPSITAATGMDALTHAVESYLSQWQTEETAAYSLAATRLVMDNLERACTEGSDFAAREAMAMASYYAGLAFTTALVGYVHALAHQLGAVYQVPHGKANAMLLPHVLECSKDAARERLAQLASHCGLGQPGASSTALADAFIARVRELNSAIGIPEAEPAIRAEDIDGLVAEALKEGHGYPAPRFLEADELAGILRQLMPG